MYESQGTTPEELKVALTEALQNRDHYQGLYATKAEAVTELEAKVAELTKDRDFWQAKVGEKVAIIENARIAIEEVLAGDVDPATTFEEFREAFELLGVKATRQVKVEISVTWRGTIELPLGVEVDDLDIDDLGISIDGHHEYDTDIDYGFEDYSINER